MKKNRARKYNKTEVRFLNAARKMPPLFNVIPGEEFDIDKSEVANWLIQLPEAKEVILSLACRVRKEELLAVQKNSDTGKWQGVDYKEPIHDGRFSNCEVCDDYTCEDGYCSWDI